MEREELLSGLFWLSPEKRVEGESVVKIIMGAKVKTKLNAAPTNT